MEWSQNGPSVEPARPELIPSFHEALGAVAAERIYIEMVEAPPLAAVMEFQTKLIEKNAPVFYALDQGRVVGWCDISPGTSTRNSHRGFLGMGLLPDYRGRGLGRRLLGSAMGKARLFGFEKVELSVYTSNEPAIRLYRAMGFTQEGEIRHYRKLDGKYFDVLLMARFL